MFVKRQGVASGVKGQQVTYEGEESPPVELEFRGVTMQGVTADLASIKYQWLEEDWIEKWERDFWRKVDPESREISNADDSPSLVGSSEYWIEKLQTFLGRVDPESGEISNADEPPSLFGSREYLWPTRLTVHVLVETSDKFVISRTGLRRRGPTVPGQPALNKE